MSDFQQNKALVLNFQAELDSASGNGITDVLRHHQHNAAGGSEPAASATTWRGLGRQALARLTHANAIANSTRIRSAAPVRVYSLV